jgi:rRNA maturation endonuclease Nob1
VERQQLQDQFKQDRQRVEDARKELDDELSQARADLAAFDKMSDTDVAVVLTKGLQQQDAGSKGQGELTYDLDKPGPVTKFPNWHGPWKTCPLCGGTGHSYASQQKTEQDASPDIAQVAGTGMSATIKNAISYCEMCGGTGQVPDYGK